MIDKARIKTEAEAFFEWPTKDKMHVTTTSMLIFANVIAEMARAEEREACAKVCEEATAIADGWDDAAAAMGRDLAAAIRLRSNAI